MLGIKVEITRFVDSHQPGFVECSLVDAHGKEHLFIDKVPVVALEELDENSVYPTTGIIGCEVVDDSDTDETNIIRVTTERPWYIESTEELLVFDVRREQLGEIGEN